jgi:hypothetical protein
LRSLSRHCKDNCPAAAVGDATIETIKRRAKEVVESAIAREFDQLCRILGLRVEHAGKYDCAQSPNTVTY